MYPASFMPFLAMASAAPRTSAAVTLQAKWFQLFHPMGGVDASEDCARAEIFMESTTNKAATIRTHIATFPRKMRFLLARWLVNIDGFSLLGGELINCCRVIVLAGAPHDRRKGLLVRRVGKVLGLETKRRALCVGNSALAVRRSVQKIFLVKLDARFPGP